MADMTGNREDMKSELLAVVQSLRARIQMDVDTGRNLNYLCVQGEPTSVKKPSVSRRENLLPVKSCGADAPTDAVRDELGDWSDRISYSEKATKRRSSFLSAKRRERMKTFREDRL
jgi:hypothetical protein